MLQISKLLTTILEFFFFNGPIVFHMFIINYNRSY